MKLESKRLTEIDCSEYIALSTNPLVRRQMPLTSDKFNEEDCMERILQLGFQPDGEVEIAGERFIRFRLYAPALQDK
jgi:hypothetical protein